MDTFGPYLLEDRPKLDKNKGLIVNSNGIPFYIVHQYDRVPEWNEYILKKYDTVINEKTNIGTAPKYFTMTT